MYLFSAHLWGKSNHFQTNFFMNCCWDFFPFRVSLGDSYVIFVDHVSLPRHQPSFLHFYFFLLSLTAHWERKTSTGRKEKTVGKEKVRRTRESQNQSSGILFSHMSNKLPTSCTQRWAKNGKAFSVYLIHWGQGTDSIVTQHIFTKNFC